MGRKSKWKDEIERLVDIFARRRCEILKKCMQNWCKTAFTCTYCITEKVN